MTERQMRRLAEQEGFKGKNAVHDFKDSYQLDSRSNIYVDRSTGQVYAGPVNPRAPGAVFEPLGILFR